ncbi:MAG: DUF4835 domain-containing protein [Flavobacteriales bacterium CG_4_9_14_0_2_um_filter_35_242]|nr:DUF4835 family protein [Zetaproteobacteria bacterium]NDK17682.1 DUF4835 family protein [Flavobacteriales bacterium]OIO09030.1 MAG: hypothetical protein AUJ53_10325 [Flavobacteriaceae bacterium CG1_02_35_72]PIR14738.1 MAG: DUF4835 domain-containing protein [Flavobacteriales bacterium CG11_big_fil_rev_8_21_14_0_20_35_7]PIV19192.1 MAG: DUF4835 domain-containing protein [Flavobacteriales bacterium CG03_land_8_20_14_0_80_35_15]PIX07989.1 MAG: DUF4835 domain-containing protein [Flavobacteriales b
MRNFFLVLLFYFSVFNLLAQELNCTVTLNADKIRGSNKSVFKTLQNSISEYLNTTKWTNIKVKSNEKIQCAINIFILEEPQTNQYKGTMQILVNRPVFNSTYQTTIFNFKDDNLSFSYKEFDPLRFSENSFDSNLTSMLTFYAYTVLGIDADSFALKGGDVFYKQAENVINLSQQSGYLGWNKIDGNGSRFELNENLLSPVYVEYRNAMYQYHREGLDIMYTSSEAGKSTIANAILRLKKIYDTRPDAFILRVFTDAKADEIVTIFSEGPTFDVTSLKDVLLKISPYNNSKWKNIKN